MNIRMSTMRCMYVVWENGNADDEYLLLYGMRVGVADGGCGRAFFSRHIRAWTATSFWKV